MGPLGSGGIMSLSPDFSNGSTAPSVIGGTSAQSTFQQPSTGHSILPTGASTGPASAPQQQQQTSGGGAYGGYGSKQAWFNALGNAGSPSEGWNGPGGGGGNLPNLDSLYQPIFDQYNAMQGQIQGFQNQGLADLTSSYNTNKGLIPGYQQAGQAQINQSQNQLQNQLQSAYDQAARNYQWANAGALNQFGYNGAYTGADSMAQQEMQREIGATGQMGVQGQMDISKQGVDLQNWTNQQNATLDTQFSQAKDSLNQYFQQQLMALNNDKTATEQQKAAGKIQLLEDVMNQNNQIALQAQNFKQQLVLYNAQMGQTGGQQYDLSSFLANQGILGSNLNATVNPVNQTMGVLGAQGQKPNYLNPFQPSQKNNDAYANSLLSSTGTAWQLPQTTAAAPQGFSAFPGTTNVPVA